MEARATTQKLAKSGQQLRFIRSGGLCGGLRLIRSGRLALTTEHGAKFTAAF